MGIFKKRNVKNEVIHILEEMNGMDPSSEEYTRMAKNLETLCSAIEKNSKNWTGIVVPIIGGVVSLGGILMIVYSEETRIITSKAIGLIVKGRI